MTIDHEINHRRSVRLKAYDYSEAGAYFVSICSHGRECLFGDVLDGEIRLNEFGMIVEREWMRTTIVRPNVRLDGYTIMPNHFHGILIIVGATRWVAHEHPGDAGRDERTTTTKPGDPPDRPYE